MKSEYWPPSPRKILGRTMWLSAHRYLLKDPQPTRRAEDPPGHVTGAWASGLGSRAGGSAGRPLHVVCITKSDHPVERLALGSTLDDHLQGVAAVGEPDPAIDGHRRPSGREAPGAPLHGAGCLLGIDLAWAGR